MTIIATNISENANETIKKFCTVRNGRKVKTERITRILPQIHRTTILERTNATGNALTSGIARTEDDGDGDDDDDAVVDERLLEFIDVNRLIDDGDINDIFESLDEIKYQSILLKLDGKYRS
jgi:hypothetical protein